MIKKRGETHTTINIDVVYDFAAELKDAGLDVEIK